MNQFQYVRPTKQKAAIEALARDANAQFIAGGTNLLDLMKRGVMQPQKLVDINRLPLNKIERMDGGIRIGALALNSAVAEDQLVQQQLPLLAQALNAGASAQLRNMATVGGNMLQRTRCHYFYDTALPCNKREPGSGCGALEGINRMHAIFGFSDKCIAVHPSDMSVALAALDATVLVSGPKGERRIAFLDFHRLPGDTPQKDTNLEQGELVVAVEVPENAFPKNVHYLKVRERASYAFALVSVAAALQLDGNTIKAARLAMGGVAHKPWRLTEAEAALVGKPATEETFRQAAAVAMQGAKAFKHNAYKLKLAPNSIVQALKNAAGLA
ncbi:xanthine dehydrogenase family protein subunit M [Hymenobacter busanensis]|uniref:Xanthine dehydrogenase family protein subunit M n=1 Tax=Hymenobacter busanensis TaxID=2607656 RepID=A0A7L4ZT60_9BACT|nr:xanthine dehydrogenase family protein subunit M [Hymenobacter busanensis]KAA9327549.1 xanthine dehydrogenase family protein subunit M [Hymenobacter busanensis]QHJ06113.1 xanthine dehydrogenase family protein subunit M [Hymenobacter busanensis]